MFTNRFRKGSDLASFFQATEHNEVHGMWILLHRLDAVNEDRGTREKFLSSGIPLVQGGHPCFAGHLPSQSL